MKHPEVIAALVSLRGNPEFERVLQGIRTLRAEAQAQANVSTDLIHIGRGQGGVHFLDAVLNAAKDAPDNLNRIQNPRKDTR